MTTRTLDAAAQLPPHELPINSVELESLFLHIIRVPDIFADAQRSLTDDLLANEPYLRLLWRTLLDLTANLTPITYQSLYYTVHARVVNDAHDHLPQSQIPLLLSADMNGIIYKAFAYPIEQFVPTEARRLLQKLLCERRVISQLRNVLQQGGGRSNPTDFSKYVDDAVNELRKIRTISTAPISTGMPEIGAALPAPVICEPTTLSYIDPWILGQRKGDMNGVLGVYGSGKTTFGTYLAITMARNYATQFTGALGERRRVAVFMSYEEPEYKVNPRIWVCASQIRKQKLEAVIEARNWGLLSTAETIEQYERSLPGNDGSNGTPILSEVDRWNIARNWLNNHFVMLDMSGSDRFPDAGRGYVPEVRASLDRLVSERNVEIGTVVIDYAGLMCKRHMVSKNLDDDGLRHMLGGLGDRLRTEVTEPLGATGWLLHQLAGTQNKFSPTKLLHHSDASESKAFAENLAVCGCLGTRDLNTGALMLNWSKVRYTRNGEQHMPRIRINGDFCRMDDISDQLVLSETGDSFVDPSTRNVLSGHAPTQPTAYNRRRQIYSDPNGGMV